MTHFDLESSAASFIVPSSLSIGLAAALLLTPASARAQSPEADEPADSSEDTGGSASPDEGSDREETTVSMGGSISLDGESSDRNANAERWIDRYAPEKMMLELGVWGGVLFPSPALELFEAELGLPNQGRKQYGIVAPDVGLRLGFYPHQHFGIEAEGGVMPASLRDGSGSPLIWTGRGHLVGQIGKWRLTPFIVAGAGAVGVASPRSAVGSEVDIGIHFGGGLKFFINNWVMLRLDVRDTLTNKVGVGDGVTHSPEILLGVSITLRRSTPKPTPRDPDHDDIPADRDKCPDQPETKNGFDDDDGCPDEVPPEFADLAGILEGILFDTDKDVIKKESKPILDRAVEVLTMFPQVRIEISGHTDSAGGYEHNMDLSQRRAASVKTYLVEAGIDAGRIETRGAGPNEPIATNDTKEGRAQNRRIEVKILTH